MMFSIWLTVCLIGILSQSYGSPINSNNRDFNETTIATNSSSYLLCNSNISSTQNITLFEVNKKKKCLISKFDFLF